MKNHDGREKNISEKNRFESCAIFTVDSACDISSDFNGFDLHNKGFQAWIKLVENISFFYRHFLNRYQL